MKTKRKLLDECDLWCIVSLPGGVFVNAGAGVKTNLLFFTKGKPTERIWYYDLSDVKVGKKTPLTLDTFEEFLRLLPEPRRQRAELDGRRARRSTRRTTTSRPSTPTRRTTRTLRTPEELLDLIEAKGKEVAEAIVTLRGLTTSRGE